MTDQDSAQNHYDLLRIKPTASPQEIRRAYRELSKLYHPDTTKLPPAIATEKFQILNEAYATLSHPEKKLTYDYSIGISKVAVIQAPAYLNRPASQRNYAKKSNAYLDPTDRPLSAGEVFALFILGITFVGCLVLVFAIGWTKGELVLQPTEAETMPAFESLDMPASVTQSEPLKSLPAAPVMPQQEAAPRLPESTTSPPEAQPPSDPLPFSDLSSKMI
ncbi:MAG: DnaJ domain-containing protein [Leptolyngbya sp. SIO1D8]|nr:DnaJ domain-containing protein [Leptolyngbya sp. SIO1D8]